jgi:cytochrome c553
MNGPYSILMAIMIAIISAPVNASDDNGEMPNQEVMRTVELCKTCHGESGRSIRGHIVPSLGGQNIEYMMKALEDLANSNRPSPTGMHSMSQFLLSSHPKKYVEAVLKHLATQNARGPDEHDVNEADIEAGKAIADAVCTACHGKDGIGTKLFSYTPNLAGQSKEYIKLQLRFFQGDFPRRIDHTMNEIAKQLTPQDVENVAAYFEHLSSGSAQ